MGTLGMFFTKRFWAQVAQAAAVTVVAAACVAAFAFQLQHYAKAEDTYERQVITEDAVARVTKLAEELAEARKADAAAAAVESTRVDAAREAELALTRRYCLSGVLRDRASCAVVGVELP